jgi:hypothetical protein
MPKPWDDTMKRLIRLNPQDFVSWLLYGAQYKGSVSIELKNWTRETDFLLDVVLEEQEILLHLEFQSTDDENMGQRLLEYNVLAVREHKRPVLSCVIYLRKDSNIAESPLVWRLPNGQEVLRFHFVVNKLWEIPSEEMLQTDLVGLLPLLPLTKGGAQRTVIDGMVTRLVGVEQYGLLSLAEMFASLVLKDDTDREWLKRRFAMYKDILEDSWVYQEIIQKGVKEERQQELQRQRRALLTIVERRFPEVVDLTRKQSDSVEDPEVLQNLIVNISLAQNVQEALQALVALSKDTQKN